MRIAVLGTGMVGRALGTGLVRLGHEVRMGSRTAGNPVAAAWAEQLGPAASAGDFAAAAAFGEVIVNATAGHACLAALRAAGADRLAGKVLVDVSNPLYASGERWAGHSRSLAERIQRAFPEARVVKTLNTMSAAVMAEPSRVDGQHTVFLSGDDSRAKEVVAALLSDLGWTEESMIDLGGLGTARGTELLLPLGLDLWKALGTANFNFHVQRPESTPFFPVSYS
ncbi:NAD(P)-binding domain-containing protein [Allokutzneria sp. A3M-2-11 16]|uniref:NADPH-dependent F420 reductase n=1 Tax=Allokutzneria sp. A3M-2-11 16 TaxID=2962043 RepID=UPI0020B6BBB2|nr:NAD(P)-binding domain-containing protein [Allokutzneria sp. A3M-2-11 16]MCP3804854.1 NAD(P)-binding domain-containing protein [Allokutzneria sp. A3M-2-11 16]